MSFTLPGNHDLSDEEQQAIGDLLIIKNYPKGTILLREGQVADKCYFILKGCIRKYQISAGTEKTTAFYIEDRAVVSHTSYNNETSADHWFECIEDCLLICGDKQSEREMYGRFPKVAEITREMMTGDFGKAQQEMDSFIVSTPEDRYLDLLEKRPELLQRVPQHQIASYIGITPESLSRIRKRISRKV